MPTKSKSLAKRPIGRPTKYKEIELGEFVSEKSIENYVLNNITWIWLAVFGEVVVKSETQKYNQSGIIKLKTGQVLPKRGPRVDLYVECKSGNNYLVEIKNPRKGSRNTIKAIGQILYYSIEFKKANKLVVMATDYDNGFLEIINKYKLPIDFILFSKNKIFLLKR
ncbi:MAG: hypothetical protein U9O94_06440 [Nanoarchaeota archaeon]|nr:hypothetical protein [Nanoarchaeota archaeon]